MDKHLTLQCIAMFVLGQVLHLFLIKIPAIQKRTRAVNKKFIFNEWWASDWYIVIGTQAFGSMCFIGSDEIFHYRHEILEVAKWFFGFVGAVGSMIAMSKLSQYEKSIVGLSDIKSNIADTFTGGTTTVQSTIEKGNEVTGKDVTKPI